MTQPAPAPTPPIVQASAAAPSGSGQAIQVLRDSILPSEREMAVDQLLRCDWRQQPEVLDAVVKAARTDPAAVVRAACVRALGKMKANTVPVVATVTALKDDPDIRVRQEVEQALPLLTR
jgi:HEAT repeat protein